MHFITFAIFELRLQMLEISNRQPQNFKARLIFTRQTKFLVPLSVERRTELSVCIMICDLCIDICVSVQY